MLDETAVTGEVTELLQGLIRNACVNDGTVDSGHESRSADLLDAYLDGAGIDVQRYEAVPGRESLVARVEGSEPTAPRLLLMGHTDVVPVTPENWERDPFGGELVDGVVWGRGAIDMLNLTASMAVALRHLVEDRWRPKGTLIYLAVADEEAAGAHGAGWLVEHEQEAIAADYVITESGGMPFTTAGGIKLPVIVAEKGIFWCRLRVRGVPGHGSQPFRTDNALVKAAQVVQRLAAFRPPTEMHDIWRRFVEGMEFPEELSRALLTPEGFMERLEALPMLGLARQAHACTHTTIAPTMVSGGVKHNVIPDRVDVAIDVRTLPGQGHDEVVALLREALGDLWDEVELTVVVEDGSTASPVETPLWDVLQEAARALVPGSTIVPFMTVGGTDARFFRRLGLPAYGFGLFSPRIGFDEFAAMFHGDNERVDVESLWLSTLLWDTVARRLLG